jgi:hypothetical protein
MCEDWGMHALALTLLSRRRELLRISYRRTSENLLKAKFADFIF